MSADKTACAMGDASPGGTRMNDTTTHPAQAYVDGLGVDYTATFVPQSESRNADEKARSLNWRIRLGGFETDYTQGIGHVPGRGHSPRRITIWQDERDIASAERGLTFPKSANTTHFKSKRIPPPNLVDVLYSLVMDASAIDYPDFEGWAEDLGYDTDSRAAEGIYRACLKIGLHLRKILDLDAARVAFEDF